MLNAIFRPVEQWPGKPTASYARKRSRFRATYATTLDDLERELTAIEAKNIVIQCYLESRDIRNDGWPRSSARPKQPGVIVTFSQGADTVSMPCDTFEDWEQNLRAIALTLHSLRMVGQYGVTKHNEQYQGFKRLSAASMESSTETAFRMIRLWSGLPGTSSIDDHIRAAQRRLHPDAGGSHEAFIRLQEAVKTVRNGGAV